MEIAEPSLSLEYRNKSSSKSSGKSLNSSVTSFTDCQDDTSRSQYSRSALGAQSFTSLKPDLCQGINTIHMFCI